MSLISALERFDRAVLEVDPAAHAALRPGLADQEIAEMNRVLSPLSLSDDLDTLLRWHNGGALLIGKTWLSIEEILEDRDFQIQDLDQPPGWLNLTDGPDYLFGTLNVPGQGPYRSVWSGDTHDAWLCRLHDSLEALFLTMGDLALDDSAPPGDRAERLNGERRSNYEEVRLRRSVGAFTYPDPPEGTYLSRFEDPDWPAPWLASVNVGRDDLLPTGDTSPISDLLDGTRSSGRVAGRVVGLSGSSDRDFVTLEDATGRLPFTVTISTGMLRPIIRTEMEADVEISPSGDWVATWIRREPHGHR